MYSYKALMLSCHIAWNVLPHRLTHSYQLKELLATQTQDLPLPI